MHMSFCEVVRIMPCHTRSGAFGGFSFLLFLTVAPAAHF
jgi:hypothetical protein